MPARLTNWSPLPTISAGTAGFRTVITEIEAHLSNAGLIKVPCTGQIDLSTYVLPAGYAANTQVGFSVFRLNDNRQTTLPVFLRLDYAVGPTTSTVQIFARAGTVCGADGSLAGRATSQFSCLYTPNASDNNGAFIYSGGTSARFAMYAALNAGGRVDANLLGIERSKSATGGDNNTGFTLVAGSTVQFVPYSTTVSTLPYAEDAWHAQMSTNSPSSHLNKRSIGLITPFNGDTENPIVGFGVASAGDFSSGESLLVNVYEQAAEYVVVPVTLSATNSRIGTFNQSYRILIRQN